MAHLIGKTVPSFYLPATSGKNINLRDFKNQMVIVYFYPKDNTPGCTQEGRDFRDLYQEITKHNGEVFGVSKDSIKSHEKFKEKQNYPFDLISDKEGKLCDFFDVIKEKTLYGKKYMGIDRSTFLISPEGVLLHEWRKCESARSCSRSV